MKNKNSLGLRYSWRGPAPKEEVDAYLLAMVLRTYSLVSKGVSFDYQPSVLTRKNINMVAAAIFIFKHRFEDAMKRPLTIMDMEASGMSLAGITEDKVTEIKKKHKAAIAKLERSLKKLICTDAKRGFVCYGG
jgi:hypothetical protein